MAPRTIKEKFDAKRAESPAAKRRQREKAERDSKKPKMKAIPTKLPSLDANAKKDLSLMPKNRIIRSVYDYLPKYEELDDDDESTGQWDNKTTDSTAERILGSISMASKLEINRSQPYQRVATPPSPVIRAHKDLAREIRDNEKHKKQEITTSR